MSRLKSIAIKGFRSFGEEVEVPLRPLNVLIGANGAGKSNFLEAFSFLRAFSNDKLSNFVEEAGGGDAFLHFGSRETSKLTIRTKFDDGDAYNLELHSGMDDRLYSKTDENTNLAKAHYFFFGSQRYPDMGNKKRNTIDRLRAWPVYHFLDTTTHSLMKKTSYIDDNRYLRNDGSNLASFLYLLRKKYEPQYRTIRKTVQLVAPFFDDFLLEPRALNPDKIRLEWRHKESDSYFRASALSDGTLRFIALATLLLQPRELRPSMVLVDEPELGLHPYGIAILAAMFRSASRETQILAATQSPILLDHFEPEDVLVADRVERQTRIERLDAGKLGEWLEDYSLGELWEKNHFGGRPASEMQSGHE